MINQCYFIINEQVAKRVGGRFYATKNGMYVTDRHRLRSMRLRPGEVLGEMTGTRQISRNEALTLIAQGGHKLELVERVAD